MAPMITASMDDMTSLRFIEFDHHAGRRRSHQCRGCVHTRVWVPYNTCRILAPVTLEKSAVLLENEGPAIGNGAFPDGCGGWEGGAARGPKHAAKRREAGASKRVYSSNAEADAVGLVLLFRPNNATN
jgi:hypothetical protein